MRIKVLFIQPSERPLIKARKVNGSITPPLGIMTLGVYLRENFKTVEVTIKDYEADNGLNLKFQDYDLMCVTGTTAHMPHAYELIRKARQNNRNAVIIIGGPHATFCDSQLLSDLPELDGIVKGEGELTLLEIINSFNGRENLSNIHGLITKNTKVFKMSSQVKNLDDLPIPAYDLINLSRYQLSTHRRSLNPPFVSLITSRGCPFSCSYCQTPNMFGNIVRFQTPKKIFNDLKFLIKSLKLKSVVFWDDTFTANKERVFELCVNT